MYGNRGVDALRTWTDRPREPRGVCDSGLYFSAPLAAVQAAAATTGSTSPTDRIVPRIMVSQE
jgi:hypothetical protein